MSDCNHNCEECGQACEERTGGIPKEKPHPLSHIRKVIGIVSGKGGVGKSLVTSLSAVIARRNNFKTAILDADITGPSIPKMFGIKDRITGDENGLYPDVSTTGIKVVSLNLLVENVTDPVIWRGPVISGVVKQFWTDVIWDDVDFMFIDMPPGTGDVPLTVFQSIPVDGIIVVTSPQELVSMIVEKAIGMAKMMNIPVIGLVENMSYVQCTKCGEKMYVFGESHLDEIAEKKGLEILGRIPVDAKLSAASDKGAIELFEGDWLKALENKLIEMDGQK